MWEFTRRTQSDTLGGRPFNSQLSKGEIFGTSSRLAAAGVSERVVEPSVPSKVLGCNGEAWLGRMKERKTKKAENMTDMVLNDIFNQPKTLIFLQSLILYLLLEFALRCRLYSQCFPFVWAPVKHLWS